MIVIAVVLISAVSLVSIFLKLSNQKFAYKIMKSFQLKMGSYVYRIKSPQQERNELLNFLILCRKLPKQTLIRQFKSVRVGYAQVG